MFLTVGLFLGICGGYFGAFTIYEPKINGYSNQIDSLALEVSRLNSTVSSLEYEISQLNDVNTFLEAQMTGLETQISILESRVDILYGDITVEQAMELNKTIELLVILDVRTVSEFNSIHIEGAINIPVDELQERLDELGKDDEILVYCRSGIRSSQAMKTLSNNGFSKVYNMLGGIDAWRHEFYPTVGCGCG